MDVFDIRDRSVSDSRSTTSRRRRRQVAGEIGRGLTVGVQSPADVLGVYVHLPVVAR